MNVSDAEQLAHDAAEVAHYANEMMRVRDLIDEQDVRWYAEEMNVPDWAVPAVMIYVANANGWH